MQILGADTLVDRLTAGYAREQLALQNERPETTNERITRLKALLESMTVPKWRFLAELTALSGMRIGEAIALNTSDVDFKQRVIRVTKTYDPVNRIAGPPKTSASNREIQMQDELYRLCKKINLFMKKERLTLGYASNLFISDINGNHINYYSYNAYLSENAERLFNKKSYFPFHEAYPCCAHG